MKNSDQVIDYIVSPHTISVAGYFSATTAAAARSKHVDGELSPSKGGNMRTILFAIVFMLAVGALSFVEAAPQTVKVGVNKEKAIGKTKLRVKFVEFIEDSRCPVDVDCIWAGNAKIKVRITSRGVSRDLTLETMNSDKPVVAHGYTFRLTGLTPVPRSNVRINPSGYIATIVANKVGK